MVGSVGVASARPCRPQIQEPPREGGSQRCPRAVRPGGKIRHAEERPDPRRGEPRLKGIEFQFAGRPLRIVEDKTDGRGEVAERPCGTDGARATARRC